MKAADLSQPADALQDMQGYDEMDIEATNWLMNEGYKSRAFNLLPKVKKIRKKEIGVCEFADTMKMVDGSSSEEDLYTKKRMAAADREELESVDGTEQPLTFLQRNQKRLKERTRNVGK